MLKTFKWWYSAILILGLLWIPPAVRIGAISINGLLIIPFVLYSLLSKLPKDKYKTTIFIYCVLYVLTHIMFIPLATSDLSIQLPAVRRYFNYLIVFFLWLSITSSKQIWDNISVINLGYFLVCLYGVFCIVTNTNPYVEYFVSPNSDSDVDIIARMQQYNEDARLGLSGRYSGITYNPLGFAVVLYQFSIIPIITLFKMRKDENKRLCFWVMLLLALICVYFTGSRGVLMAIILAFIVYLFEKYSFPKFISICVIGGSILFVGIINGFFPNIQVFIDSFINDDIGGSSMEGRFGQYWGVLLLLGNEGFLFGKGIGFSEYYFSLFGTHTNLQGLESLLSGTLLTYGFLGGIIVLVVYWFGIYYLIKKILLNRVSGKIYNLIMAYVIGYFFMEIAIGAYAPLNFFVLLFFTLRWLYLDSENGYPKLIQNSH